MDWRVIANPTRAASTRKASAAGDRASSTRTAPSGDGTAGSWRPAEHLRLLRDGRLVIGLARRSFTKANPMPRRGRGTQPRGRSSQSAVGGLRRLLRGVEYLPDPDELGSGISSSRPAPTGAARSACRAPPQHVDLVRRVGAQQRGPLLLDVGAQVGDPVLELLSRSAPLRRRDRAALQVRFRVGVRGGGRGARIRGFGREHERRGAGASTVVAAGAKSSARSLDRGYHPRRGRDARFVLDEQGPDSRAGEDVGNCSTSTSADAVYSGD